MLLVDPIWIPESPSFVIRSGPGSPCETGGDCCLVK